MQSAELEELIQVITNQVVARLRDVTKSKILFQGEIETYPAPYVKKLSADDHFMLETKQDSDAILLCLRQLTISQLLAIVRLITIDEVTGMAIDFLLAGKPIWIFSRFPDLTSYRRQAKFTVWKQIQAALQTLETMNVHFISDDHVFSRQFQIIQKRQTKTSIKRKFISRLELEQRWQVGKKLLAPSEILTDEAADWANKQRRK